MSSSIWLSFQTHGEFALPLTSWTYVNVMLVESDHLSCYCTKEFLPNLSQPLYNFSLYLMPDHPKKSNQVLVRNQWSSLPDHRDPLVYSRQAVKYLWVMKSYTHITLLPEFWRSWSCCLSSKSIISSHQMTLSFLKMDTIHVYLLILRCRSAVYCSRLHFI